MDEEQLTPMTYTLYGRTFEASEEAADAFNTFNPEHFAANDRSPWGMVEELKVFTERTKDMKRFIDVGALFGIFSLVFTDSPEKSAVAIEPSPWAFPILQEQVSLNPDRNIQPLNVFAGSETGAQVECGSDWKHVIAGDFSKGTERLTIQSVRLDDIVTEADCMKIDVEGYEEHVLRGAKGLIERCKPMIFLEVHPLELEWHGGSPASLLALLKDYGYEIEYYIGEPVQSLEAGHWNRVICK